MRKVLFENAENDCVFGVRVEAPDAALPLRAKALCRLLRPQITRADAKGDAAAAKLLNRVAVDRPQERTRDRYCGDGKLDVAAGPVLKHDPGSDVPIRIN